VKSAGELFEARGHPPKSQNKAGCGGKMWKSSGQAVLEMWIEMGRKGGIQKIAWGKEAVDYDSGVIRDRISKTDFYERNSGKSVMKR
jgi:hypothetical protein